MNKNDWTTTISPKNSEGYLRIHHNDIADEYVDRLAAHLNAKQVSVCTNRENVKWVNRAIERVPDLKEHYRITVVVEASEKVTAFAIFYFDLIKR